MAQCGVLVLRGEAHRLTPVPGSLRVLDLNATVVGSDLATVALVCRATDSTCSVGNYDPCRTYEGNNGCSGFQNLFLSGTDGAGPYTVVVLSTGRAGGSFTLVVTDNGT